MKNPITTTVAHSCCVCRKIIKAGDKHYYDAATKNRYHVKCDPDSIEPIPAPAQVQAQAKATEASR